MEGYEGVPQFLSLRFSLEPDIVCVCIYIYREREDKYEIDIQALS